MDKQDLISIIIPIYNKEKELQRCLNSILNQTYKKIEIILVDDGSDDNSIDICKKNIRDKRVLLLQKENGGVSSARNLGIKNATGEWIMFVDPDDYVEHNIVEELYKRNNKIVDIIACSCIAHINGDDIVHHFFETDRTFNDLNEKNDLFLQLMDCKYGQKGNKISCTAIGVPWGKLYRNSFLKKYNLFFDEALRRVQDNLFNMYAFYYAREIIYMDLPLYQYFYEHADIYVRSYNKNYKNIYLEVIRAKYKCIHIFNIYKNTFILSKQLLEIISITEQILRFGIFNKESGYNYKQMITEADYLLKEESILSALNHDYADIRLSGMVCCFIFVLKNRLYFPMYLYWNYIFPILWSLKHKYLLK